MKKLILLGTSLFILTFATMMGRGNAATVTPTFVAGNPSCTALGYKAGFKVDPPTSGTYNIDGTNTVTLTSNGTFFNWTSTLGIDAVISKGGPNSNVYAYDPPAESFGDTALVSPTNPNNNQPYGLSHVEFCYDYEVQVSKTANATFTRDWSWTIDKTCDQTNLTLSTGQSFTVNCSVTVDASSADSNYGVNGAVSVFNPDPGHSATLTGVTDIISGFGAVPLNCGVTFPYVLPALGILNCTYATGLPDATNRTNTATATTTGAVAGGSGQAAIVFGNPTTENDECVTVNDNKVGPLGQVCAGDAPHTFNYAQTVGPFATCGPRDVVNTASFATNDTTTTGSASWTVAVNVPCVFGCTLTQGYWKTHNNSFRGGAPADDTWALLGANAENTTFYLSGQSWFQVFWTAPQGNVYYNLAHQFMAARLNKLNGANVPANVQTALNSANTLFNTYTPAQVAAFKGNNAIRAQFVSLAGILGSYNEGITGPGHCSENQ